MKQKKTARPHASKPSGGTRDRICALLLLAQLALSTPAIAEAILVTPATLPQAYGFAPARSESLGEIKESQLKELQQRIAHLNEAAQSGLASNVRPTIHALRAQAECVYFATTKEAILECAMKTSGDLAELIRRGQGARLTASSQ